MSLRTHSIPGQDPSPWNPGVKTPLRIGFFLREHFSMVAFTAAVDALVTTNLVTPEPAFEHFTIGARDQTALSDLGIEVFTTVDTGSIPVDSGQTDLLIVCGGLRSSLEPEPGLLEILRAAHRKGTRLGGLWNGAIPLIQAGLVDHQVCALHPDNHPYVREHYPQVTISPNAYEIGDRFATSAGPASTLRMMLKIISQLLHNPHIVQAVREILSCDQVAEQTGPTPLSMGDDPALPETLQTLLALMRANIEEPLTLEELAEFTHISHRHMERLFQTHLETSPARYYLHLRLVHAHRLLVQTNRSIHQISLSSGFVSNSHFSNCFKGYYGKTPSAARRTR